MQARLPCQTPVSASSSTLLPLLWRSAYADFFPVNPNPTSTHVLGTQRLVHSPRGVGTLAGSAGDVCGTQRICHGDGTTGRADLLG